MTQPLSPRLEHALEIIYRIEGISFAKIWQWDGGVAVAVRARGHVESQLQERLRTALASLRLPNEEWTYGVMADV